MESWVEDADESDQSQEDKEEVDHGKDLDAGEEDGDVLGGLKDLKSSCNEGGHLVEGGVNFTRVGNAHLCNDGDDVKCHGNRRCEI